MTDASRSKQRARAVDICCLRTSDVGIHRRQRGAGSIMMQDACECLPGCVTGRNRSGCTARTSCGARTTVPSGGRRAERNTARRVSRAASEGPQYVGVE